MNQWVIVGAIECKKKNTWVKEVTDSRKFFNLFGELQNAQQIEPNSFWMILISKRIQQGEMSISLCAFQKVSQ